MSSADEKIRKTNELLEEGEKAIANYTSVKEAILVLGNSGVGKTPLTMWLTIDNSKLFSVQTEPGGPYLMRDDTGKIGNSTTESATVYPDLFVDPDTNTSYFDFPGFHDTRGIAYSMTINYFMKKIVDLTSSIKLIFAVNYDAVKIAGSRDEFMKMIKSLTEYVIDIDKFRDSICFIVTKVPKRINDSDEPTPNELVIQSVARFIANDVRTFYEKRLQQEGLSEEEKRYCKKALSFIDIILTKDGDTYQRIGLFRLPDREGPFSQIEIVQRGKKWIQEIIIQKLRFQAKTEKDFQYTLSDEAKNDVGLLENEFNENIAQSIQTVATEIQRVFSTLMVVQMDKIRSFVTSPSAIDVDPRQAEDFTRQFNNGQNATDTLLDEIRRITIANQLVPKLNTSLVQMDVRIQSVVLTNLSTQCNHLSFLQQINADVKNDLSRWVSSLNNLKNYFAQSYLTIDQSVSEVRTQVQNKTDIEFSNASSQIQLYYDNSESDVRDFGVFYQLMKSVYEQLNNIAMNGDSGPKRCARELYDYVIKNNIVSAQPTVNAILKYADYIIYMDALDKKPAANSFPICSQRLNNIIRRMDATQKWYRFLYNLSSALSEYKAQGNLDQCKSDAGKINPIRVDEKASQIGLEQLLRDCVRDDFELGYEDCKNIIVDVLKMSSLQKLLRLTLQYDVTEQCDLSNNQFIVQAPFVKFSSIHFENCTGANMQINVFAAYAVFVDADVNKTNKTQFTIIAPSWHVRGNRKISLVGVNGTDPSPLEAYHSAGKPGEPGGLSGNFFGLGRTVENDETLSIIADGGTGGMGQNGARGRDGENGEKPPFTNYAPRVPKIWKDAGFEYDKKSSGFPYPTNYYTVYGKSANAGTSGFDGGSPGLSGNPGNVTIAMFDRKATINISTKKGEDGKPGKGGKGGTGGKQINLWYVTQYGNYGDVYVNSSFYDSGKHAADGGNGVDGKNNEGQKSPDSTMPFRDLQLIVNSYKMFLRNNLNTTTSQTDIQKFLDLLENRQSVLRFYNTLGLVDDFQRLEYQYYQWQKPRQLLPYYQYLRNRIDKYAQNRNAQETTDQYKKVLGYLYTSAMSKISSIENVDRDLIINVNDYLAASIDEINELKEYTKAVEINKRKDVYQKSIDDKITEANGFIQNVVTPEIDGIVDQTHDQIDRVLDQIMELIKEAEKNKEKLQQQIDSLRSQMVLRSILGAGQIVGSMLSFAGPVGAAVGAGIGAISSVSESLGIDDRSGEGIDKIASIPSSVSKSVTGIVDQIKKKQQLFKEQLDDAERELKKLNADEVTSSIADLRDKIAAAKEALEKEMKKGATLDPASINVVYDERKKLESLSRDVVTKLKDEKGDNDPKAEKQIQIVGYVQGVVSLADIAVGVYERLRNDQGKINQIKNAIDAMDAKIAGLRERQQKIYDSMIPVYNNVVNAMAGIKEKITPETTRVALDVQKWQMQSYIKDVQMEMRRMTQGFEAQDDLMRCMDKLDFAMETMIQLYDRIQDYREKAEFADYLTDITSTRATAIKVDDQQLNNALVTLQQLMQTNIVLRRFNDTLNAFKQYVFPFANQYFAVYNLPGYLQVNSTAPGLISFAENELTDIQKKLRDNKNIIHTANDRYIFPDTKFGYGGNKPPFFTWQYDSNANVMRKLLAGEEITLKAHVNHIVDENAIKFDKIGIRLAARNETLQSELERKLSLFSISMTHLGISTYRCGNKTFIITHESQYIVHSMNKVNGDYYGGNNVYTKITANNPLLSPYAMWKFQLIPPTMRALRTPNNYVSNSLSEFKDAAIDLELEGHGQYIQHGIDQSVCTDDLAKYYQFDKIIQNSKSARRRRSATDFEHLDNEFTATSSASNLKSPINTVFSWLSDTVKRFCFTPTLVATYRNFKEGIENSFLNINSPKHNTANYPSMDHFDINSTLVLADFLTRCVTKTKPYSATESPLDLPRLRALVLDIVDEFEIILDRTSDKYRLPVGAFDFEPIRLMAKLEKSITNGGYGEIERIILDSIAFKHPPLDEQSMLFDFVKGEVGTMIETKMGQLVCERDTRFKSNISNAITDATGVIVNTEYHSIGEDYGSKIELIDF